MNPSARLAFEESALPHLDSLYRVARRLCGDPSEAEDLVQDALVRAYRFWGGFEPGTNVRAWLFTILRNTFYSELRRRVRARAHVSELSNLGEPHGYTGAAPQELPSPESAVESKASADRVHQALAEIPEDYRLAVVLADMEGFSYKEIAEVVGCPIGTVMSRLYRGRRQLHERLKASSASSPAPAAEAPVSLDAYRKRGHG